MRKKYGPTAAHVAQLFIEDRRIQVARALPGDIILGDKFMGDDKRQSIESGGGAITGVVQGNNNTFRDIKAFNDALDQSGANINGDVQVALADLRRELDAAELSAVMKPMVLGACDKLVDELAKGEKKNPSHIQELWTLLCTGVKTLAEASTAVVAAKKLGGLLALAFV